MPYDQLSRFLQQLEASGELLRIQGEVDPRHQIAAITCEARNSGRAGGPALLFESVKGARLPVVTNLLGTPERLRLALAPETLSETVQRLEEFLTPCPSVNLANDQEKSGGTIARLSKLLPTVQKTAFSQQVARLGRDINLFEFPFPRHFDGETGPTITCAQLWISSIETGQRWISSPVLEVGGPQSLLVHWPLTDSGPDWVDEYRRQGRPAPVLISLGGDPLFHLTAQLAGVPGVDAMQLAGVVRGSPLNLVRARTLEMDGPADAEMLIEGYIDPQEIDAAQGTVASPSGLLVSRQRLAVIRVTAVTHRSQAVLPSVVHAAAASEAQSWSAVLSSWLQPVIQRVHPSLQSLEFCSDEQGRRIAFVGLRTRYLGHARQTLQGLAHNPLLADVSLLVAVDEDVDVTNTASVWRQVSWMADPVSDFLIVQVVRDIAHCACRDASRAGTLLIDATRKPDPRTGGWIEFATPSPDTRAAAAALWRTLQPR